MGAVAKGYITDGIADILEENGVGSALINLGGNVYAKGKRPDGKLWQIGVRSPESESEYLGVLSVADMAVVTSGDYERYFEYEGVRYHHILDPKTGRPAKSGLRSVTVICKDAALADMLSTKCFIAGFEEGAKILKDSGAYGIFVTEERDVFYSAGLDEIFIPQSDDYKYTAF